MSSETSSPQKLDVETLLDYFDSPDYYSKIVRYDYMCHQEFFGYLNKFLEENFQDTSFSILDIGCNDAFIIKEALKGTNVASYTGVDLSKPALETAEKNLAELNCKKSFKQGNYIELFQSSGDQNGSSEEPKFDVIWTSFMMHHLSTEDKRKFLELSAKLLKPGGRFILVDQVNQYGSRNDFLQAVEDYIFKTWSKIEYSELEKCMDHCWTCDFPETKEDLLNMFRESGFDKVDLKFCREFWGYIEAKKA